MTLCVYYLDYEGILDFYGLFPQMEVNARISYARSLFGEIERKLIYLIIYLSFENPIKYSQSCTGVVKDDTLPARAPSPHCPVAGLLFGGKDRLFLSLLFVG